MSSEARGSMALKAAHSSFSASSANVSGDTAEGFSSESMLRTLLKATERASKSADPRSSATAASRRFKIADRKIECPYRDHRADLVETKVSAENVAQPIFEKLTEELGSLRIRRAAELSLHAFESFLQ